MIQIGYWKQLFEQMRFVGKYIVKEDIKDFGNLKVDSHWQYGFLLWLFSDLLTLLNIFFPFDKEIEKAKLKTKIEELENAKQRLSLPNKQITTRKRWQISTSLDG